MQEKLQMQTRTIGIVLMILAQIALIIIWAINGYENTLFYATLLILCLSIMWTNLGKKKGNRK